MPSNIPRRALPSIIGLSLLTCALSAHSATGARVMVQAWNPLEPDKERNETLLEHPTLVSDSLQDAWSQARPKICEKLRLKMGLDGAARGETLRDIECQLDEQVVLDVTHVGQNALRAKFAVSGYVKATSTTPDIYFGIGLGEYADPRFSISLTAKFDLILTIQPDRNQTLRVSKAQFTLNSAKLDSHNATGDLAKFVAGELVSFFGGPDYKAMAESAINAVSENFAEDFNGALGPVNAQLTGPAEYVRVGVSGRDNYISVAFAPRAITPPTNGSVTGLVRWDPAKFTPRNGCQSFEIRAEVQTGPVPLYASDKNPPMLAMGVYEAEQTGVSTCAFTLSKIAEGWPNVLTSRVADPPIVKNPSSSNYRETYRLAKDGWNERRVVPQPALGGRNYRVSAYTLKMADMVEIEPPKSAAYLNEDYRTNPKFPPAEAYLGQAANPASANVLPSRVSDGVSLQVETVRLNPQPLPPDPEPDPVSPTRAADTITQPTDSAAAIIIVGGKPAYQRVKQATPAQAIDGRAAQPQP